MSDEYLVLCTWFFVLGAFFLLSALFRSQCSDQVSSRASEQSTKDKGQSTNHHSSLCIENQNGNPGALGCRSGLGKRKRLSKLVGPFPLRGVNSENYCLTNAISIRSERVFDLIEANSRSTAFSSFDFISCRPLLSPAFQISAKKYLLP